MSYLHRADSSLGELACGSRWWFHIGWTAKERTWRSRRFQPVSAALFLRFIYYYRWKAVQIKHTSWANVLGVWFSLCIVVITVLSVVVPWIATVKGPGVSLRLFQLGTFECTNQDLVQIPVRPINVFCNLFGCWWWCGASKNAKDWWERVSGRGKLRFGENLLVEPRASPEVSGHLHFAGTRLIYLNILLFSPAHCVADLTFALCSWIHWGQWMSSWPM